MSTPAPAVINIYAETSEMPFRPLRSTSLLKIHRGNNTSADLLREVYRDLDEQVRIYDSSQGTDDVAAGKLTHKSQT